LHKATLAYKEIDSMIRNFLHLEKFKKGIKSKRKCTLELNRNQTEQWMPKKESYEKRQKQKVSCIVSRSGR
jgi:hypothetical protein